MQSYIILLVLLSIISFSNSITVSGVANVNGSVYTKFTYSASPDFSDPTAISLSGARLTKGVDNATYQQTGFSFYTPPFNGNLGYYFGYFDEAGQFVPNSATLSISASAIELIANFLYIIVYYDRNGQDGFQYVLGNELSCGLQSPSATTDCVDWANKIAFSSLTWAPIAVTILPCPAGYDSNCNVYAFTASTSGTDAGMATFTYKLASQPVFIDNVMVTQDYAKIDVSIAYPWYNATNLQANPKIGLIAATAGKTANASATVTYESGKPSVLFFFSRESGILFVGLYLGRNRFEETPNHRIGFISGPSRR
jgi:hypothetical protein